MSPSSVKQADRVGIVIIMKQPSCGLCASRVSDGVALHDGADVELGRDIERHTHSKHIDASMARFATKQTKLGTTRAMRSILALRPLCLGKVGS